jgi:DNA-binding CsgD family transcriptional regulator
MSDGLRWADAPPHPSMLTLLQREIVVQVLQGQTNQQIALHLGTSPGLVGVQIGRIVQRLGLSCRAEIVAWAAEQPYPRPSRLNGSQSYGVPAAHS